jgi:hypothetical protein
MYNTSILHVLYKYNTRMGIPLPPHPQGVYVATYHLKLIVVSPIVASTCEQRTNVPPYQGEKVTILLV